MEVKDMMKEKIKNKKIIIFVIVLIIIIIAGVGGYFGYKSWKNNSNLYSHQSL